MAASAAKIEVAADPEALARYAAQWITDLAQASGDRFAVCLSGGSTPKRLYQLLAAAPYRDRMPWERVHWFWGDERFVPRDHPDSNYGMTAAAMLNSAPIPPANIHGVEIAGTPDDAARAYQRLLQNFYGGDTLDPARPLFDVTLLGMGPDGHTASLLPGSEALDEMRRWAVAVTHGRPEARITLTYPVLDSSRHVAFLAAGADKHAMMERVLSGEHALPAARIRPVGELHWMVDAAARKGS
jgi:6-phosphogluconolactonase